MGEIEFGKEKSKLDVYGFKWNFLEFN